MSSWFKRKTWLYSSTRSISSKSSKGLSNDPGQNNCFLNSAVQVLWHLDAFRESFNRLKGHICSAENCVYCAMESLFRRFHCSSDDVLPPVLLREAMAETFQKQNRFQLGLMDDAAECFENLLHCIHSHIVETKNEDTSCTAQHCISHQNFGLMLIQQGACKCGETTDPLPFTELVHYVSATSLSRELHYLNKQRQERNVKIGTLIKLAGNSDVRTCPSRCGEEMYTRTTLVNDPKVVSIGIVWDSEVPQFNQIASLIDKIDTVIKLTDMFDNVMDKSVQKALPYHLSAIVCYYGKHYTMFLYHGKKAKWLSIDDANVVVVGKRWLDVRNKLLRGHHQPLLLLYSLHSPDPLPMDTCPQGVSMAPELQHKLTTSKTLVENGAKPKAPLMWTSTSNNNSEEPQSSKFGQYVEPQAATWTTYKPY